MIDERPPRLRTHSISVVLDFVTHDVGAIFQRLQEEHLLCVFSFVIQVYVSSQDVQPEAGEGSHKYHEQGHPRYY